MRRYCSLLVVGWLALVLAGTLVTAAAAGVEARELANLETFDAAWELIYDKHFDPEFNGVDWLAVRVELRPRAGAAADDQELRRVLEEMLGRLGQSHFGLIPGDGEADEASSDHKGPECAQELSERLLAILESGRQAHLWQAVPGIDVRLIDGEVLVTRVEAGSPAREAGILAGWRLVRVDDQPLDAVASCLGDGLEPPARKTLAWTAVSGLLAGPVNTQVGLQLDDGTTLRTFDVRRVEPRDSTLARFGNLPPIHTRLSARWLEAPPSGERIGLIRFNIWMMPIAPLFERAIVEMTDADGVVIDLRGNPGGIAALAQGVAGYFVDQRLSLGTMRGRQNDLEFFVNPRRVTRAGDRLEIFEGPLAILVDELSASTSEIFAAGLQDHGRARVFGVPSAAAALPATLSRLPNGDLLMHATADFTRPNGTPVEGVGVTPDEIVPVTRAGLIADVDEPLLAARDWVAQEVERKRLIDEHVETSRAHGARTKSVGVEDPGQDVEPR